MNEIKLTNKIKKNRKLLYKWLEEQSPEIKKEFLIERKNNGKYWTSSFYSNLGGLYPESSIASAFSWSKTKKGYNFYDKLSNKLGKANISWFK